MVNYHAPVVLLQYICVGLESQLTSFDSDIAEKSGMLWLDSTCMSGLPGARLSYHIQ